MFHGSDIYFNMYENGREEHNVKKSKQIKTITPVFAIETS